jgi:hypothetical protein
VTLERVRSTPRLNEGDLVYFYRWGLGESLGIVRAIYIDPEFPGATPDVTVEWYPWTFRAAHRAESCGPISLERVP